MKKILSLMLALLMVLFVVTACSEEEGGTGGDLGGVSGIEDVNRYTPSENNTYNDSFVYEYVNGDEVKITGFSGSADKHVVSVPATIANLPVTMIGEGAFANQNNISQLVIPNSVKHIEKLAFAKCVELVNITIPNEVESIGDGAFYECINLREVILPGLAADSGVVFTLGSGAFYKCTSLATVTLPATLLEVKENTFYDCVNLTTVNLGAITTIGDYAFSGCVKLNWTAVPASVTTLGDGAFSYGNPATRGQMYASVANTVTLGGSLDSIFCATPAA